MQTQAPPWIEIYTIGQASQQAGLPNTAGYDAIFAVYVVSRPFDELAKWKWGFGDDALLREARERQLQFVENCSYSNEQGILEPQDQRTLALRFIHQPDQSELTIVVLGKVWAPTSEAARYAALEFWEEIKCTFPYDYKLFPLTEQAEYMKVSALWSPLFLSDGDCYEIYRFEGTLKSESERLIALGIWNTSNPSAERIWRILSGCQVPVILSILLRPTCVYDDENLTYGRIAEQALELTRTAKSSIVRQDADLLHKMILERSKRLGYAFLAQVHLISSSRLPKYVPRSVASALTNHRSDYSKELGGQMLHPRNAEEQKQWLEAITRLNIYESFSQILDIHSRRFRYLVNANEAGYLFQLPFPSRGGIPDVKFLMK